jgi:hypothetical protein
VKSKKVYLIKAVSSSGDVSYKIGKSVNPQKRVKELQTGNSNKLEISCVYDTQYVNLLESTLHIHFKQFRMEGEWFAIDESVEDTFISICDKYEKNFDILRENTYVQNLKRFKL